MVSVLSSLFSSSKLSTQIETLRAAESGLVSFAKKFGKQGSSSVTIFDTHIPRSSVPIINNECMLFKDKKKDDDTYIIHGVHVSSDDLDNPGKKGEDEIPLVLMHGYCNGALYFYRNLCGLSNHFKSVYSIDMFGWGLSSRPPFRTQDKSVESAEAVFVESLEAWRYENGIEKMILGGHSMGGYYAVAYCEKYPERVEKLFLISPVGVPHLEGEHTVENASLTARTAFGLVKTFWRNNITPGSVMRTLSESRGRNLVRSYLDRRIPAITSEEEKKVLHEYMYTNNILPGSGEFALNRVLKPIAYARKPTIYRIPKLKVPKVTFIYGAQDWMDPIGGHDVKQKCEEYGNNAPHVKVYTVRDAGHLMFLENWEEFNAAMIVADDGELPLGSPVPREFDPSLNRPLRWDQPKTERDRDNKTPSPA